jgi:hypothetical protein
MHLEEALYPGAKEYNPDRWLNPKYPTYQEPLTQFPNLKRFSAFGFGRRICPGLESAERSLFIQISHIAWACSLAWKKDENGIPITVSVNDYTPGSATAPKTFPFVAMHRGAERVRLLQENCHE